MLEEWNFSDRVLLLVLIHWQQQTGGNEPKARSTGSVFGVLLRFARCLQTNIAPTALVVPYIIVLSTLFCHESRSNQHQLELPVRPSNRTFGFTSRNTVQHETTLTRRHELARGHLKPEGFLRPGT